MDLYVFSVFAVAAILQMDFAGPPLLIASKHTTSTIIIFQRYSQRMHGHGQSLPH